MFLRSAVCALALLAFAACAKIDSNGAPQTPSAPSDPTPDQPVDPDGPGEPVVPGGTVVVPPAPARGESAAERDARIGLQNKIERRIRVGVVDEIAINPELGAELRAETSAYFRDMQDCGFTTYGPSCPEPDSYVMEEKFYLDRSGERPVYVSLHQRRNGKTIVYLYAVESLEPASVSGITILLAHKPVPDFQLKDFLSVPSNFTTLGKADLPQDYRKALLERVGSPANARALYHATRHMLDLRYPEVDRDLISVAFAKNESLIVSTRDSKSQIQLIDLAVDELPLEPSAKVSLLSKLSERASMPVRSLAAAQLLRLEPARLELKPLVLHALTVDRWQTRKIATIALTNANQLTPSERGSVLMMMNDSDKDVRDAAYGNCGNLAISKEDLTNLRTLSQSEQWETRKAILALANRIPGPDATAVIAAALGDADDDVREEADRVLVHRDLVAADLPKLVPQLKSESWQTRLAAVMHIARIKGDDSMLAIIPLLSDSDDDVRKMVEQILKEDFHPMTEKCIAPIARHLSSESWETRKAAIEILADRFDRERITPLLIPLLADSDDDVRTAAWMGIPARVRSPEVVPALKKILADENWQARKGAAEILGRIKDPSALAALRARLPREDDNDVKEAIRKAIAAIQNDN